ncbi:MAG TPA: hypothetical protein VJH05_01965 [Candidatus Paceibacterota bacterium]
MKIGFDFDGVIIDHTLTKIKLAADFGFEIQPKDTPPEILKNILSKDVLEKFKKNLYYNLHQESFLMNGVLDTLNKITTKDLPFFLISRRHQTSTAVEILIKNKLWPQYFNKSNSFFVVEKEDKDIKAKELGITHYFDDEISVLEKLKNVSNKFLFDTHNVFPESELYTKVSSWEEIKKQLHV